jgi:hypothetical protein
VVSSNLQAQIELYQAFAGAIESGSDDDWSDALRVENGYD